MVEKYLAEVAGPLLSQQNNFKLFYTAFASSRFMNTVFIIVFYG